MRENSDSDANNLAMAASLSFTSILKEVQTSNLNFRIELSPFAAVIHLKKSLITNLHGTPITPPPPKSLMMDAVEAENSKLREKIENLENILKDNQKQEAGNAIKRDAIIHELEIQLEKAKNEIADMFIAKNSEKEEVKSTSKILANKDAEIKALEVNTNHVKAEVKALKNDLKSLRRDLKDKNEEVTRERVKTESLEQKVKNLMKSNKELYFDKLKLVQEKQNEGSITNATELIFPVQVSTVTSSLSTSSIKTEKSSTSTLTLERSSQTEQNLDIPYDVTSPLPPIFSSQLCYNSKRIHFLAKSLPNLSTMNWVMVTDEDQVRDEAEEALCQQYDKNIKEYYRDKHASAKAVKEVFDENLIAKLYEENS